MEKTKLQELLELDNDSHGDYTLQSYSGRGMYGKQCLGVSTHKRDTDVIISVFQRACKEGIEGDALTDLCEDLGRVRQDSLGRGNIVYFPGVEYVGDGSDDEEDEDTL